MGDDTPCFYSDWYYTEESENLWERIANYVRYLLGKVTVFGSVC